ncbi:YhcN/YlaJ family sporulation lipoprotein [Metabacillus arenae]|uniref:YhcN/YlaJ family sporulation lipoprotein n=1 Tax=Metabacillus arenae TaxID=2771434 RepID=A0A926NAK8_9BACI|nr:YhcN/YlaJ family sporulation lipoprotein [Metabacillus arenae]MBD1380647.1 YhcN/YlaJ family sporulation lipoprotein [Metabacillus arenae]
MKNWLKGLNISLFLIAIIGLYTGCAGNQNQFADNTDNANIVKVHTSKPIDQTVANKAKEKVIKGEEISGVKAVNTDKELFLALKIDQFDRFRLKNIEKKVKTDLEKTYPDHKILVSTDSKMYLELGQLEVKLQKDNTKMKTLKKEFNRIKSLMKEKT